MSPVRPADCPRERWLRVVLPWMVATAGLISSTGALIQLALNTGHFRPFSLLGHLLLLGTGLFWFVRPPVHASRAAFFVSAYLSTQIGTFILKSGEISSFANLAMVSLGAAFTIPRRRYMLAAQAVAFLWVGVALAVPLKAPDRTQLIVVGGMMAAVGLSARFARVGAASVGFEREEAGEIEGDGVALGGQPSDRPDAPRREPTGARPLSRELVHDVNNLLGGILGGTDLALASERHPEDLQFALHQIRERTLATRDYLRDAARGEPALTDMPASVVVERAIALARGLRGSPIALVGAVDPSLPKIRGDRSELERAVLNLILNAIDASPDGSGEVSVRTRLDRSPFGDFVAIRVEDDGVGIDPEIRSKIFEPGFTTRGGEHRGLGLAFVARVVADHGGEVVVDERKKTGSAIEIRIPTRSQSVEARPDRVDREAS